MTPHRILPSQHPGQAPEGGQGVVSLLDAAAARHGRRRAVSDALGSLSHGALHRGANRLAHHLGHKPVRPGDVVGLLLEPSCALAVALQAVWKAGAIALPMDPAYPAARLQRMLEDAGCRQVITQVDQAELLQAIGVQGIHLDAEAPWIDRQPATPPAIPAHRLACLLYTSGSSGQPKGVPIAHAALVHKLVEPGAWGRVGPDCRALWHSSPGFDASLAQCLLPLVHGGRVHALASHDRLQARRVWDTLRRQRTTVLDATPSWLMALLDTAPPGLALQTIVLGGETLTPALARRLQALWPRARLVNVYGPTEACIDATAHEVSPQDLAGETVPIGRALPGYRIALLDASLEPVRDGEAGELCIAGIGVAEGYWRQPEASAARFLADPAAPSGRRYRTGDLARRRADGALEFLGRADRQVKLRGQRLELDDIEAHLSRIPGVQSASVGLWPQPGDLPEVLAAHLVLRQTTPAAVRARLQGELPAYMLPTAYVLLDEMPLTPNGKVDRRRLPPPVPLPAAGGNAAAAVDDAVEQALLGVWHEVLGVRCGTQDNFFEVGGDSLRAVELLLAVGERFGVELSLGALLAHPTVCDMAVLLARGDCAAGAGGRVLRLSRQAAEGEAPLFLLPPGSGAGLVYAGLARRLAARLPCIALQAVQLGAGPAGRCSMADLACQFADDAVRLQPQGALRLAGYSAGGAAALTLVQELARRGRDVSHLLLLDPYGRDEQLPTDTVQGGSAERVWRNHCADMLWDAFGLRGAAALPLLAAAQRLAELDLCRADARARATDAAARRALQQAQRALPGTTSLEVFLLLLESATNIGAAYAGADVPTLAGYRGRACIVQPASDPPALREARRRRWQARLRAPLQAHLVPGEHATLLQRAHSLAGVAAAAQALFSAPAPTPDPAPARPGMPIERLEAP